MWMMEGSWALLVECYSNSVLVCVWLRLFSLLISTSWSSTQHDQLNCANLSYLVTRFPGILYLLTVFNSVVVCTMIISLGVVTAMLWARVNENDAYFLIPWYCALYICTAVEVGICSYFCHHNFHVLAGLLLLVYVL